jgi:hypothetical protein
MASMSSRISEGVRLELELMLSEVLARSPNISSAQTGIAARAKHSTKHKRSRIMKPPLDINPSKEKDTHNLTTQKLNETIDNKKNLHRKYPVQKYIPN